MLTLDSLVIEVTRKCNLTCDHCLRGDVENISVNLDTLELFLKDVNQINYLTLTGGEPLLDPYSLKQILNLLKKYEIYLGHFYIATNATVCSDETLLILLDWWLYSQDKDDELRSIEWSNDVYHDNDPDIVQKLKVFSFAGPKYSTEYSMSERTVIPEGRGTWGLNQHGDYYPFEIDDYEDCVTISGDLYLNCLGMLINGCDWSYETQNKKDEIRIVHVPTWKGSTSKNRNKSLVHVLQQYNKKIAKT